MKYAATGPRMSSRSPPGEENHRKIGTIGMNTSDVFNSGQSLATSLSDETDYPTNFGDGPSAFHDAIQAELTNLGSTLTPVEIVKRAQVQACAGCHRFSNNVDVGGMIWPPSLGFTHISERDVDLETVAGVTRFKISDALVNLLLPARKQLVEDFLNEVPLPPRAPAVPIGGPRVHRVRARRKAGEGKRSRAPAQKLRETDRVV